MNMGVNLVEILSLFASSLLVAVGIGWCFGMCGAVLILSAVLCQRNREIRFNLLKLPISKWGLFLENSIKTGSQIQVQAV